jgi:hypothetical protein
MELEIKDVQLLRIKDGDALIVNCEQCLSMAAYQHIKGKLEEFLRKFGKPDVPIIVLDGGLTIEVLTKE